MSSPLSSAITSEQWERVVQLCNGSPKEAKKWTTRQGLFEGIKDANVLPIHEALVAGAPYRIIEALINAYPDCVFCKESSYQRLPLHCACRKNAFPDVVNLLSRQYPDAALTPDSLGRLPSTLELIIMRVCVCERERETVCIYTVSIIVFFCTVDALLCYIIVLFIQKRLIFWLNNSCLFVDYAFFFFPTD
mmetsp:Transcript_3239/g.3442  ORF Transcript_3239/g.3442 Transcript_3239/m.3442 type:complete len:191 (-) Transcript_3239:2740-3312(-)